MTRRYEHDPETREGSRHGQARQGRRDEDERSRAQVGPRREPGPRHSAPSEQRGYRGPRGDYGRDWGWSDQVWSGEGRFDEGGIGQGRYGPGPYESRYREAPYGQRVYGVDQYGWTEYDEPRYVGSFYRGERRGEEPYREHEWQRTRDQPGLLGRVYARGPKGYTRSDERIKEDISERLWQAEHIDSSDVTIAVKDGTVTLTGTVPERWMRLEIENVADGCMGVQDIENNIRVQRRMTDEARIETPGARSSS